MCDSQPVWLVRSVYLYMWQLFNHASGYMRICTPRNSAKLKRFKLMYFIILVQCLVCCIYGVTWKQKLTKMNCLCVSNALWTCHRVNCWTHFIWFTYLFKTVWNLCCIKWANTYLVQIAVLCLWEDVVNPLGDVNQLEPSLFQVLA